MSTDRQNELPDGGFVAMLGDLNAGSSEVAPNPNTGMYNSDFDFSGHSEPGFDDDTGLQHIPDFSEPVGAELQPAVDSSDKASTSVDLPASRSEYNRLLFEARMNTFGDAGIKMPWETGVMKQIFDSDDESIFPSVVPPVPAEYFVTPPGVTDAETGQGSAPEVPTARSLVRDDVAMPIYSFAVKVLPDRDFFIEESMLWDKALQKWLQVFEVLGFPGTLGAALLYEHTREETGAQSEILRDALGIKSPRTAIKRAQTLQRYFAWLQQQTSDWDPWERSCCLRYMGAVGAEGVPASRGTTFLEASQG